MEWRESQIYIELILFEQIKYFMDNSKEHDCMFNNFSYNQSLYSKCIVICKSLEDFQKISLPLITINIQIVRFLEYSFPRFH